jgi:hypothetical protein
MKSCKLFFLGQYIRFFRNSVPICHQAMLKVQICFSVFLIFSENTLKTVQRDGSGRK